MIDTTGLNAACLSAFGEALTFTVNKLPVSINGVVTRPRQPLATDNKSQGALPATVLGPDDLLIEVRTTDYAGSGIGRGATVTIDSRIYKVIKPWPDDGGMTKLELRT